MKNKRGLELGITEIVGIVLAIAMLAFGLMFIRTQSLKGERLLEGEIDVRTLESAGTVLDVELEDKNLVISKTSFGVSRGEGEVFLIGVKNNGADNTEIELVIISGNENINSKMWFVYKAGPVALKANEKYYYTTKLNIPDTAESGDYIFDINLMSSGAVFESQNILVSVK